MKNPVLVNERISKEINIGECQGIITDTDTIDFHNYSAFDYWVESRDDLRKKYNRVSLIDIIKIKKEYRRNGYGEKLIEKIYHKSNLYKAEAIILMADILEENDFDLISWYEKHGFELYKGCGQALPIMIKEVI